MAASLRFRKYVLEKARESLALFDYCSAFSHYLLAIKIAHDQLNEIHGEFVFSLCRWTELLDTSGRYDEVSTAFAQAKAVCYFSDRLMSALGEQALRVDQLSTALSLVREAQLTFPGSLRVRETWEHVAYTAVERWHFKMLNDLQRNTAYRDAIVSTIHNNGVNSVLDIGCGTGLLSVFADSGGARQITLCDAAPIMTEICSAVLASHDHQTETDARFRVFDARSTNLYVPDHLPDRVDLVVTEVFDAALFGEHCLSTLSHAWTHLLHNTPTKKGCVIPRSAQLYLCAIECPEIRKENFVHQASVPVLDLSGVSIISQMGQPEGEPYTTEDLFCVRGSFRFLSPILPLLSVDFNDPKNIDSVSTCAFSTLLDMYTEGTVDALAVWFDLDLCQGVKVSTSPSDTCCWEQAVFPVVAGGEGQSNRSEAEPTSCLRVNCGDQLSIQCALSDGCLRLIVEDVVALGYFLNNCHISALLSGSGDNTEHISTPLPACCEDRSCSLSVDTPEQNTHCEDLTCLSPDIPGRLKNKGVCSVQSQGPVELKDQSRSLEIRGESHPGSEAQLERCKSCDQRVDRRTQCHTTDDENKLNRNSDCDAPHSDNNHTHCTELAKQCTQSCHHCQDQTEPSHSSYPRACTVQNSTSNKNDTLHTHESLPHQQTEPSSVTICLQREEVRRLNDLKFNSLYLSALQHVLTLVNTPQKMLTITSGPPFLGLLALKLGFRETDVCYVGLSEREEVERLTSRVAQCNSISESRWRWCSGGVEDAVEECQGCVDAVWMDVVETSGCLRASLVSELSALSGAVNQHALLMPQTVDVYAVIIDSEQLHAMSRVTCDDNTLGVKVAPHINPFQTLTFLDLDIHALRHDNLTDVAHVFHLDLQSCVTGVPSTYTAHTPDKRGVPSTYTTHTVPDKTGISSQSTVHTPSTTCVPPTFTSQLPDRTGVSSTTTPCTPTTNNVTSASDTPIRTKSSSSENLNSCAHQTVDSAAWIPELASNIACLQFNDNGQLTPNSQSTETEQSIFSKPAETRQSAINTFSQSMETEQASMCSQSGEANQSANNNTVSRPVEAKQSVNNNTVSQTAEAKQSAVNSIFPQSETEQSAFSQSTDARESAISSTFSQTKQLRLTARRSGRVTAVVFWFDQELAPGVRASTVDPDLHWRQAAYMLNGPCVQQGQDVVVTAQLLNTYLHFSLE